ncbi:MAG: hypothetical protein H0U65_01720 [Rubrobacter sp.]|nr:hypothetical protein [Rubrobacter sp.]
MPAVLAFLFVRVFGVNSLFADQWMIAGNIERAATGSFMLSELWSSHHEHVIAFPRLVMITLGLLTNYDVRFEMLVIVASLAAAMVVYSLAFRREFTGSLWCFAPVAFLAMSLRQHGNMLWGFQITLVFALLFCVLAFFLLDATRRGEGSERRAFLLALIAGFVATFSSAPGLLAWPIGLVHLLLIRASRRFVIAWGGVGAAIWAVYFGVLVEGAGGNSPFESLARPLVSAEFFVTLLGGSMFAERNLAFGAGVVIAALVAASLVFVLLRGSFGEDAFWVSVILFSLFSLAFVAAGRLDSGIEQALLSRYATFSIPAVIGAYVLLAKAVFAGRFLVAGAAFGVALVFVLASLPFSYLNGIRGGESIRESRGEAAEILSNYEEHSTGEIEAAHGWEGIEGRAAALERLGYSVFAEGSDAR